MRSIAGSSVAKAKVPIIVVPIIDIAATAAPRVVRVRLPAPCPVSVGSWAGRGGGGTGGGDTARVLLMALRTAAEDAEGHTCGRPPWRVARDRGRDGAWNGGMEAGEHGPLTSNREHGWVAHRGTRGASSELSKARQIVRVRSGHGKARGHEERSTKVVVLRANNLHTKCATATGRRDTRREHGWEEVVREAKLCAAATEDALITDTPALKGVIAAGKRSVDDIEAALLSHESSVEIRTQAIVVKLKHAGALLSRMDTQEQCLIAV